jgi:tRNA threonylcarbamoyladenosine biosynthesis protein TsaB
MNILALDTATEACSLALLLNGKVYARHVIAGRDHTALLLPLAHELMAEAGLSFGQLEGLVCGIGPGSFAGVRIGLGWIKGLALARDLPVVPVSSLATLAQGAIRRFSAANVLACIDARMDEVYVAVYQRNAAGLAEACGVERVCPPQSLGLSMPAGWVASGSGWRTYAAVLLRQMQIPPAAEEPEGLPEARDALSLGLPKLLSGRGVSADQLVPVYLRDQVALTLEQQAEARRLRMRVPAQERAIQGATFKTSKNGGDA